MLRTFALCPGGSHTAPVLLDARPAGAGSHTAPSVHPIRRRPAANATPGWCLLRVQANQWYLHFSREEGAELGAVKSAIQDFRATCADQGINVVLGFGPTLLPELTDDVPEDFQP